MSIQHIRMASNRATKFAKEAWVQFVQRQSGKPVEVIPKGRLNADNSRFDARDQQKYLKGSNNGWKTRLGEIFRQQKHHENSLVTRCQKLYSASALRMTGSLLRGIPAYGLVGVVLANNHRSSRGDDDIHGYDTVCETIRNLVTGNEAFKSESEDDFVPSEFGVRISDYDIGKMIGKGCNAAVYEARLKQQASGVDDEDSIEVLSESEDSIAPQIFSVDDSVDNLETISESADEDSIEVIQEVADLNAPDTFYPDEIPTNDNSVLSSDHDSFEIILDDAEVLCNDAPTSPNKMSIGDRDDYDLAIKVAFNYDAASNAYQIMQSFEKEAIPTKMAALHGMMEIWENGHHSKMKWRSIPAHPNIVDMRTIFVGEFPLLADAMTAYPLALPLRLNPDGCGRNMTMFLVMKKYETTLRNFVESRQLSTHSSSLLLLQLLEGVLHMSQHGIAHRDLKSDNIFLDTKDSSDCPQLAIGDFGCCLAGDCLRIPYQTSEISKGGNQTLMCPEIVTASPGFESYLDYSKADVWTAGTLAYEIFGQQNPFYRSSGMRLNSSTYSEEELPLLHAPEGVQRIVRQLLLRDQDERPDPKAAANMMQIAMWGPKHWLESLPCKKDVISWLVVMATDVRLRKSAILDDLELQMKQLFLSRVDFDDVMEAIYSLHLD